MEIKTLLPKLTEYQQQAADLMVKKIGFDMFIKSALFRVMHKGGATIEVNEELDKWSKKVKPQILDYIKELWVKHG